MSGHHPEFPFGSTGILDSAFVMSILGVGSLGIASVCFFLTKTAGAGLFSIGGLLLSGVGGVCFAIANIGISIRVENEVATVGVWITPMFIGIALVWLSGISVFGLPAQAWPWTLPLWLSLPIVISSTITAVMALRGLVLQLLHLVKGLRQK